MARSIRRRRIFRARARLSRGRTGRAYDRVDYTLNVNPHDVSDTRYFAERYVARRYVERTLTVRAGRIIPLIILCPC
jgi:hypothetical protein